MPVAVVAVVVAELAVRVRTMRWPISPCTWEGDRGGESGNGLLVAEPMMLAAAFSRIMVSLVDSAGQ